MLLKTWNYSTLMIDITEVDSSTLPRAMRTLENYLLNSSGHCYAISTINGYVMVCQDCFYRGIGEIGITSGRGHVYRATLYGDSAHDDRTVTYRHFKRVIVDLGRKKPTI